MDVFTGVCGNTGAVYPPLEDPFYSISMSLADFLGVNPIGIRKPVGAQPWSTKNIPFAPKGGIPDRVVTMSMDVYAEEGSEHRVQRLVQEGAEKVLEAHLRSQMALPFGIDVHEVSVHTSSAPPLSLPLAWLAAVALACTVMALKAGEGRAHCD